MFQIEEEEESPRIELYPVSFLTRATNSKKILKEGVLEDFKASVQEQLSALLNTRKAHSETGVFSVKEEDEEGTKITWFFCPDLDYYGLSDQTGVDYENHSSCENLALEIKELLENFIDPIKDIGVRVQSLGRRGEELSLQISISARFDEHVYDEALNFKTKLSS